ncbi:MAG TPA: CYCXC family (seleno)protein [Gemmatimonadales bacterium]|nr:CYCXC family (seleno)protein [Gemmatimonadales bacterium]
MNAKLPWAIAGAALLALVLFLTMSRQQGHAAVHPDPRPDVTAERVLPPAMLSNERGVLEAYAAARSAPQVLDGIFCYCQCARNFGHRSLLTCFESDHGSRCDICMGEAMMATQLAAQGNSLGAIRRAIDARFAL